MGYEVDYSEVSRNVWITFFEGNASIGEYFSMDEVADLIAELQECQDKHALNTLSESERELLRMINGWTNAWNEDDTEPYRSLEQKRLVTIQYDNVVGYDIELTELGKKAKEQAK